MQGDAAVGGAIDPAELEWAFNLDKRRGSNGGSGDVDKADLVVARAGPIADGEASIADGDGARTGDPASGGVRSARDGEETLHVDAEDAVEVIGIAGDDED